MRAQMAPVIGPGMTQDRDAAPKVTNPHGFSIEWLRIEPGSTVGPFRIAPKQVLIVQSGRAARSSSTPTASARRPRPGRGTCSRRPATSGARFTALGDEPAVMTVTTAGDARAIPEWSPEIRRAAWAAGLGLDPNDYVAPAAFLPGFSAPDARRPDDAPQPPARSEGRGHADRQCLAVDRRRLCRRERRACRGSTRRRSTASTA